MATKTGLHVRARLALAKDDALGKGEYRYVVRDGAHYHCSPMLMSGKRAKKIAAGLLRHRPVAVSFDQVRCTPEEAATVGAAVAACGAARLTLVGGNGEWSKTAFPLDDAATAAFLRAALVPPSSSGSSSNVRDLRIEQRTGFFGRGSAKLELEQLALPETLAALTEALAQPQCALQMLRLDLVLGQVGDATNAPVAQFVASLPVDSPYFRLVSLDLRGQDAAKRRMEGLEHWDSACATLSKWALKGAWMVDDDGKPDSDLTHAYDDISSAELDKLFGKVEKSTKVTGYAGRASESTKAGKRGLYNWLPPRQLRGLHRINLDFKTGTPHAKQLIDDLADPKCALRSLRVTDDPTKYQKEYVKLITKPSLTQLTLIPDRPYGEKYVRPGESLLRPAMRDAPQLRQFAIGGAHSRLDEAYLEELFSHFLSPSPNFRLTHFILKPSLNYASCCDHLPAYVNSAASRLRYVYLYPGHRYKDQLARLIDRMAARGTSLRVVGLWSCYGMKFSNSSPQNLWYTIASTPKLTYSGKGSSGVVASGYRDALTLLHGASDEMARKPAGHRVWWQPMDHDDPGIKHVADTGAATAATAAAPAGGAGGAGLRSKLARNIGGGASSDSDSDSDDATAGGGDDDEDADAASLIRPGSTTAERGAVDVLQAAAQAKDQAKRAATGEKLQFFTWSSTENVNATLAVNGAAVLARLLRTWPRGKGLEKVGFAAVWIARTNAKCCRKLAEGGILEAILHVMQGGSAPSSVSSVLQHMTDNDKSMLVRLRDTKGAVDILSKESGCGKIVTSIKALPAAAAASTKTTTASAGGKASVGSDSDSDSDSSDYDSDHSAGIGDDADLPSIEGMIFDGKRYQPAPHGDDSDSSDSDSSDSSDSDSLDPVDVKTVGNAVKDKYGTSGGGKDEEDEDPEDEDSDEVLLGDDAM